MAAGSASAASAAVLSCSASACLCVSYVEKQRSAVSCCLSVLLRDVPLADRRKLLRVFPQCFCGLDAVMAIVRSQRCSQSEAAGVLSLMLHQALIQPADTHNPITQPQPAGWRPQQAQQQPGFDPASYYQFTPLALKMSSSFSLQPADAAQPQPGTEQSAHRPPSVELPPAASTSQSSSGSLRRGARRSSKSSPSSSPSAPSSSPSSLVPPLSVSPGASSPPSSASSPALEHSGWLEKRAESGLHSFQRRFFVLSLRDAALCYYRQPSSVFPMHFIPLSDILHVQLLPEVRRGCRFDLLLSHRVHRLQADSPQAAAEWVAALSRAVRETRERQQERTAAPRQRQPEPRTPTVLRPFWQQVQPTVAAAPPAASALPSASPSLSGLKLAFFHLNFSVSALSQPDFFHELLADFRTDDDILAFLLDALLQPNSSQRQTRSLQPAACSPHAASSHCLTEPPSSSTAAASDRSERGQSHSAQQRDVRAEQSSGRSACSSACSSSSSRCRCCAVCPRRARRAMDGACGSSSRLQLSVGSRQDDVLGRGGVGDNGRRERDDEREDERAAAASGVMDAALRQQKARPDGRQPHSTSASRCRQPLRRSVSDLCLQLEHLAPHRASACSASSRSRSDDELGLVSPLARLRSSLPMARRYELYRASANRSRDYATLDSRKRVVSWLHSDTALRVLSSPQLLCHRLAVPLLWSALQSRQHDEADDDSAAATVGSAAATPTAAAAAHHRPARTRRSSSFDRTGAGTGSGSLAAIFRQQPSSASAVAQPEPAASGTGGALAAAAAASSPAFPSSSGTSSFFSSSSELGPFRSHLLKSAAASLDAGAAFQDRDGEIAAVEAAALSSSHSPQSASTSASSPPHFPSTPPAPRPPLAFASPFSAPLHSGGGSGARLREGRREGKGGDGGSGASSSEPAAAAARGGAANRYATMRLPASPIAHSAANSQRADTAPLSAQRRLLQPAPLTCCAAVPPPLLLKAPSPPSCRGLLRVAPQALASLLCCPPRTGGGNSLRPAHTASPRRSS